MSPKNNSEIEPKIVLPEVQEQALDIAAYMLYLDKNQERKYFVTEINSLLNKMLHLANILHYTKFRKALFSEAPMLTEDGVIISSVYEFYNKRVLQPLGIWQKDNFHPPFHSD